jgi:anion-transporting  ArsA/GET3 family ATPase
VVVRQPGPLVAAESERLVRGLSRAGLAVHAVVDNRWDPEAAPDPGATGELPADALGVTAPALDEPPVGPAALRTFLSRWRVRP